MFLFFFLSKNTCTIKKITPKRICYSFFFFKKKKGFVGGGCVEEGFTKSMGFVTFFLFLKLVYIYKISNTDGGIFF